MFWEGCRSVLGVKVREMGDGMVGGSIGRMGDEILEVRVELEVELDLLILRLYSTSHRRAYCSIPLYHVTTIHLHHTKESIHQSHKA